MSTSLQTLIEEMPKRDWRRRVLLQWYEKRDREGGFTAWGQGKVQTWMGLDDLCGLLDAAAARRAR